MIQKIVIAHIRSQNETLVQAQTNQSILMKDCWDFLHYHKDCHGVYEDADCSVNCSRLSDPEAPRLRHEENQSEAGDRSEQEMLDCNDESHSFVSQHRDQSMLESFLLVVCVRHCNKTMKLI
ncbi:Hypothetical protein SMAX5B_009220 [Scophthalmus maximus]|uniref:Uncharacterized protein n=1 Tax=Scophthalmus maximus TaxID=52904 RepID=A0A2U9C1E7_SCOMX|nr:Hypothetical protein SMAX5B_009220 [Scophthalmus maximus]